MKKLTVQELKDMEPGTIFLAGTIIEPRLYELPVRWVAKRGEGYHDWTIYYGLTSWSFFKVEQEGDKCFTKEVIRELIDCDDDSFALYRF